MQAQALPYENMPLLMQVLKESFSGDNQSVQIATATLQAMANDPIEFVNALMRIISMEKTDDEIMKIKIAATTALTNCLLNLMREHKFHAEQRNYTIEAIIQAMFSDFVSLPMKVNLQYFLLYLYTVDIGSEMTNKGLILVKEKLTSNNVHNYPPAFLVLQAVINTAQSPQESIANWFEELREPLINIGGGLARGIMIEIEEISKGSQAQEKVASIFIGLKIFKMWILTIHEFIKLLSQNNSKLKMKPNYLKVILVQDHLVQIFSAMIMLTIRSEKQIKDCVFSTSGLVEVDQLLNNVKTSALKSFNKVLDLMDELNTSIAPTDNKFFIFSQNYCINLMLTSVVVFFKHENLNLEAFLNDKDLSELVVESITFLTKLTKFPELYPTFALYIKPLIIDVCFSLIKTTNAESEMFKNDPTQFVNIAMDCVGPCNSQTPKTQAAKFLTKLCLAIDGALSYATIISLCMIDYSMVSDKREEIPNTHKDLTDFVNSIFIAKTDPTTRVETCLLILSILSTPIGKRDDLLPMIEGLMTTYKDFFLGDESKPIIKARVCLLLSSYVHVLFRKENQQETYAAHLRFLLTCAGLEGEEFNGLSEQANQSLHSMFEREYLTAALAPYVCDFLTQLNLYVLYCKANKFFDIIHEIVATYHAQILEKPELLIRLVEALVQRWQQEFELAKKNPTANNIIFNRIWNVLRAIGGKPEYVLPLQGDIETALEPMFKYLENNDNLNFDEDILNYISSVTKISKKVSPAVWEVFKKLPNIFERYQGILSHIFPALNQVIMYGRDVINGDEGAVKTLIDIGIHALNPSHHSADEANFSEGAVLLQLILQYLSPISPENLRKILLACFDKLHNAEQDFLKARLGDVYLCAFLHNFEATQAILNSMQATSHIMDLFVKNVLVFEAHAYDRKLLIIGLSSLLVEPNLAPEIQNRLPEIFNVIVSLLKYIGYMEQREAKRNFGLFDEDSDSDEEDRKTSNKDILLDFLENQAKQAATIDNAEERGSDEEDEDEDDDDDENDHEPYALSKSEANAVVRNLETVLKEKDEFVCFNEAIGIMKQTKPEIFRHLVEVLPEKKQRFLNEVLQSRRVNTEQEGRTQARKIVKAGAKKIAEIKFTK